MVRPIFFLIAFLSALLLLGGCGDGGPDVLALDIDGRTVELPLDRTDVNLVDPDFESEHPESFEIVGPGVVLCGTFPMATRVGYEENYANLRGKPMPIAQENLDTRDPKRSSLVIPGVGQALVESGSFVVDKIAAGEGATTYLGGTVTLRLRTAGGETTVNGTFKVGSKTWG